MPKIKNIPYTPEESFGIDQNYGRQYTNKPTYLPVKSEASKNANNNYSRYGRNPDQYQWQMSNYKSFQYDKQRIVPVHEVKYNPQFCKSPLASMVINKQDRDNNQFRQNDIKSNARREYDENQYNQNQKSKCNPVVLAILGILALVALLIGIYFIFKSISNSNNDKIPSYNLYDLQDGRSTTGGLKPIQIQPIPFYQKSNTNVYYPTDPNYSGSNSLNSFATYPSAIPETAKQNGKVDNSKPVLDLNQNNDQVVQNSISPINVYASKAV